MSKYPVTPEDVISYEGGEGNAFMVHDLASRVADLINGTWDMDKARDSIVAWLECHGDEQPTDTRPYKVYRATATEYVSWECEVVARDENEAWEQAKSAASAGWFVKDESYDWCTYEPDQVLHEDVRPSPDNPQEWVSSTGDKLEAYHNPDLNGEATNG